MADSAFKNVCISDKTLSIDVILKQTQFVKYTQILKALQLLATMYPEVKKVKNLMRLLVDQINPDYIPCEIKIPVVSSLGIKAVIKISEINHTPFS